ncbi:amidohydrolase family protein [Flammeovirgaceae bacterium]
MKSLTILFCFVLLFKGEVPYAQTQTYYLQPDRVFDGNEMHEGWVVLVAGNKITEVGPANKIIKPRGATALMLTGTTIMPGMIEGHSHLLLYPYNQTSWNDQVMKESDAYRVARATIHAKKTLMAGFTTVRDLGTEGAGYADVGLKKSIEDEIIPGPRMIVAGRAIVATGSYGPKGFDTDFEVMLGAEPADGNDLIRVTRDQIGKGADVIKVYADYRWGVHGEAAPTFSIEELKLIVEAAKSSGRPTVVHASTKEGMRRAILAGVETIEHGDQGDDEIFKLMKEKGIAFCPTLAAGDAILQYNGWKKGIDPDPKRILEKKASFKSAIDAGVTILAGGDVGVFEHGTNAHELELMVDYGLSNDAVLKSVTSVNAKTFHLTSLGEIKPGFLADLIAVKGNPSKNISDLRKVSFVMKDGVIYKQE